MTFTMICYGYEIEAELVVGWLEDELIRVLRFFAAVLCEERAWVVINRNCVDCEAMCGSLNNLCQVEL